jgi:hypothetical protein
MAHRAGVVSSGGLEAALGDLAVLQQPGAAAGLNSEAADSAARSRFTRLLMACLWCQFGFFYGMSPLVLPVANEFGETDNILGGAFLFGSAIMMTMINVVAGASILVMPLTPTRCRFWAAFGIASWLVSVALMALSMTYKHMGLFLFSFAPAGFGMGVFNFFLHVTLSQVHTLIPRYVC